MTHSIRIRFDGNVCADELDGNIMLYGGCNAYGDIELNGHLAACGKSTTVTLWFSKSMEVTLKKVIREQTMAVRGVEFNCFELSGTCKNGTLDLDGKITSNAGIINWTGFQAKFNV